MPRFGAALAPAACLSQAALVCFFCLAQTETNRRAGFAMDLHAFLKSINCMPADPPKQDERRFSLKGTFQKGKEYADTQLQLIKLGVVERVSRIIARLLLDVFRAILALL